MAIIQWMDLGGADCVGGGKSFGVVVAIGQEFQPWSDNFSISINTVHKRASFLFVLLPLLWYR